MFDFNPELYSLKILNTSKLSMAVCSVITVNYVLNFDCHSFRLIWRIELPLLGNFVICISGTKYLGIVIF